MRYLAELDQFTTSRIGNLNGERNQSIVLAGLVVAMRTMNTRRGGKMAFVTLDDRSGRIELAVFGEEFEHYREYLAKDRIIVVEGELSVNEDGGFRVRANRIMDLEQARNLYARCLVLRVNQDKAGNGFIPGLVKVLEPFREGSCPVQIDYQGAQADAVLRLGDEWRINPSESLIQRLGDIVGPEQVQLRYH